MLLKSRTSYETHKNNSSQCAVVSVSAETLPRACIYLFCCVQFLAINVSHGLWLQISILCFIFPFPGGSQVHRSWVAALCRWYTTVFWQPWSGYMCFWCCWAQPNLNVMFTNHSQQILLIQPLKFKNIVQHNWTLSGSLQKWRKVLWFTFA